MERTAEFNLNHSISSWRNRLWASGNYSQEDLDELASHLVDEMDGLREKGLIEEEQFLLATHRLGSTSTLDKAYEQSDTFRFRKISWFAQAFIFMSMLIILSKMARLIMQDLYIAGQLDNQLYFLGIYLLLELTAVILIYFIYGLVQRKMSLVKANTTAIIGLIAIVSVYLGYAFIFPSDAARYGQALITIFWGALFYFLAFVWFVVINIRHGRKTQLRGLAS